MGNTAQKGGKIKSSGLTLAIIDELRKRDGAGVTELAEHFDNSKSTIHEHLRTLEENGYVSNSNGRYTIGLRFLELGGHARTKEMVYRNGKKEIDELAQETEESAKLVVEQEGKGIYLYQEYGNRAVITDSHVGTRVHLHSTAVGKAILAHLDEGRVSEIIESYGLPSITEKTITDTEELRNTLEQIRNRGVAYDDEERIAGIRCVAAPIRTEEGPIGAVSVSGPKKRIDDEKFRKEYSELVTDTARVIEINCKYTQ